MTDLTDLERLARAMDAAEDAVIAASGQHREDLWNAHHEARRAFHDAADPQTVLALLEVAKLAGEVLTDLGTGRGEVGYELEAELRSALAALASDSGEGRDG